MITYVRISTRYIYIYIYIYWSKRLSTYHNQSNVKFLYNYSELERITVSAVFTKFSRPTNITAAHLSQTTSMHLSKFRAFHRNVEVEMAVHD